MKKANYFVSCMAILACGCSSLNGGFAIKGSLEEKPVYLVSAAPGATDTLATGTSKDGKVQLTGKVDKPVLARLVVEGGETRTLFLENGNTYVLNDGRFEATTEAQKRINQFDEVVQTITTLRAKVTANLMQLLTSPEFQESMTAETSRLQERLNNLITADPDSELTAYLLYAIEAAGGNASNLVDLLGENAKTTAYAKALKIFNPEPAVDASVVDPLATPVGEIAPDFTLPTPGGETLSLHGVKAKLKLIDFWASWCAPCRGENPNVVKVYAEYHPKGLEIIGVSLDSDRAKWLKAIEDDHLAWKHGSDLQGWQAAPAQLYGVKAIPFTVLVDENNKVIALNLRGDALKAKIAELLD
jgi:thiol-disulfide isomerase/thioredoxin